MSAHQGDILGSNQNVAILGKGAANHLQTNVLLIAWWHSQYVLV